MTDAYGFYLGQPWWLLVGLVIVPMIWLARRNLAALGAGRRAAAIVLRTLAVLILVVLLARPMLVRESRRATVIAVVDRSQSIPTPLADAALDYLSRAVVAGRGVNQLAVVDVAEAASISKLPSSDTAIRRRNTTLSGGQSHLAGGIEMALAIAPPDTATRIVLLSEGNETEGDLKEAAKRRRPTGSRSTSSRWSTATTGRCSSSGWPRRRGPAAARRSRSVSSSTAPPRSAAS